jgi:hypothetical protein
MRSPPIFVGYLLNRGLHLLWRGPFISTQAGYDLFAGQHGVWERFRMASSDRRRCFTNNSIARCFALGLPQVVSTVRRTTATRMQTKRITVRRLPT